MKHLYIDFDPNGITGETHSPYDEMYTLLYALWGIYEGWIPDIKKSINEILKSDAESKFIHFDQINITILNNEDLLITAFWEEPNPEKYYLYIKQEALWQAVHEYNQFSIYSKKYKRITISYDGNKVYFDLEPFETNKENV